MAFSFLIHNCFYFNSNIVWFFHLITVKMKILYYFLIYCNLMYQIRWYTVLDFTAFYCCYFSFIPFFYVLFLHCGIVNLSFSLCVSWGLCYTVFCYLFRTFSGINADRVRTSSPHADQRLGWVSLRKNWYQYQYWYLDFDSSSWTILFSIPILSNLF